MSFAGKLGMVASRMLSTTIPLAQGSILLGNSAGVAAALVAKDTTKVLVGNGTTLTSVALSSDVTMANTGAVTIASGAVTRAKASGPLASKFIQTTFATIATSAGNNYAFVTVPEAGALAQVLFSCVDALTTNDTNYVTFSITNLTQAGAGSTVMLLADATNTTKATGGTALVANGKRYLFLTATAADLNVAAGDRLRINVAASGTLANTLTYGTILLKFTGTT